MFYQRKSCLNVGLCGKLHSYIYLWISLNPCVYYVGETNKLHGVVSRAYDHVQEGTNATLRNRMKEHHYNLDDFENLFLLSYPLPSEDEGGVDYSGNKNADRLAVEYKVNDYIFKKLRDKHIGCFTPLANTNASPEKLDIPRNEITAEQISDEFVECIIELQNKLY